MSETTILKVDDLNVHVRGDGVETMLLATQDVCGSRITTGFTSFPPGREVPVHKHNCDEQVTLIGVRPWSRSRKTTSVSVRDTTYIEAGTWHGFIARARAG